MKILYIQNTILDFKGGCYHYRAKLPAMELLRRGHEVKFQDHKSLDDTWVKWADWVVFQRQYNMGADYFLRKCKQLKKKIAYDIDDDVWNIEDTSVACFNKEKLSEQAEKIMAVADVVTTTTPELAKKLKKFNKNVVVIPNAIRKSDWQGVARNEHVPIVCYSGSASHWADFLTILPSLHDIQKVYRFHLIVQGFTEGPIQGAMFVYDRLAKWEVADKYQLEALKVWEYLKGMEFTHVPFYPVEMHPSIMAATNSDIGLCPLEDNDFNTGKSCIKFYEYAANDVVTLAPNLLPYKKEVNLLYKNKKDFEEKFIELLTDKEFRKKTKAEQKDWVNKNRTIEIIGDKWEKAYGK